MEGILFAGLLVVLVVLWIYLRNRLTAIDARIDALAATLHRTAAPQPQPQPQPQPYPYPTPPPPVIRPWAPPAFTAPPAPADPPIPAPPVPERVVPPPLAAPPPQPTPARIPVRTSEEWEAPVGGNWLNKIGVFIVVLGLAFGLDYAFA
jgi:uncharacterized membrane protein